MTDLELAAAHEVVKAIEYQARTTAADDREVGVVLRQAVALRRVLGNAIVARATSALHAAGTR